MITANSITARRYMDRGYRGSRLILALYRDGLTKGEAFVAAHQAAALTVAELLDLRADRLAEGPWVPACGGTEEPFTVKGRRVQYLWQPSTGRHAYIDLDTDIFLNDEEAQRLLG